MLSRKARILAVAMVGAFAAAWVLPAFAEDENPFRDVPPNSWAYQSIVQLYKDGIIVGYPNGYFNGKRPLTRYEMAAILDRAVTKLKELMRSPATAAGISPQDMEAMKKLVDTYAADMAGIHKEMASLNDLATRFQAHLYLYARAPGSYHHLLGASDGTGAALPTGTVVAWGPSTSGRPSVCCGPDSGIVGSYGRGSSYQLMRLFLSGNLNNNWSYLAVLGTINFYGVINAVQFGAASPGSPLNQSNYFYNEGVRVLDMQVNFNDPSGFNATVGKFVAVDGPFTAQGDETNGLLWSDFFLGARLGFQKNGWNFYGAYSFNNGNNLCPGGALVSGFVCAGGLISTGEPNITEFAHLDYQVMPKLNVAASWIMDRGIPGETVFKATAAPTAVSLFGPTCTTPGACGAYVPAQYPVSVIAGGFTYDIFKTLRVGFQAAHRFGNNPSTPGSSWVEPNAIKLNIHIGEFAPKLGNNYANIELVQAGLNSLGSHTGIQDVPDYFYADTASPNGYRLGKLGLYHWVSDRVRLGIVGLHWSLEPNTVYPIGGVVTDPTGGIHLGSFVTSDNVNRVMLETWVNF